MNGTHASHHDDQIGGVFALSPPVINGIFTVTIIGEALLVLLLLTFLFARDVRTRSNTIINLVLIATLDCTPSTLLFISGEFWETHPSPALCLAQVSLKHGGDTAFVTTPTILALQLFLTARSPWAVLSTMSNVALLAVPYVVFLGFGLCTLILGMQHPDRVVHVQDNVVCQLDAPQLGHAIVVYAVIMIVIGLIFEVMTAVIIHRTISPSQQYCIDKRGLRPDLLSAQLQLRIGLMTLAQFFYLLLSALNVNASLEKVFHPAALWYAALSPVIVFLVFGLTPDCLACWCFWRGPKTNSEIKSGPTNFKAFRKDSATSTLSLMETRGMADYTYFRGASFSEGKNLDPEIAPAEGREPEVLERR